jgi:hypothetical protein
MVMGRLHDYAPKNIVEVAPDGIDFELARLYYDIAGTGLSAGHCSADEARSRQSDFVRQRQSVRAAERNGVSHEGAWFVGGRAASNRPRECPCAPAKLASNVAR